MNTKLIKKFLPQNIIEKIKRVISSLEIKSVTAALKKQGLYKLYERLPYIVPDVKFQFTAYEIKDKKIEVRHRALQAFQFFLMKKAVEELVLAKTAGEISAMDIGDSGGASLMYLEDICSPARVKSISVNIDENAVRRIKEVGLEAVHADAEDLDYSSYNADLILSFETLEHMENPVRFLKKLSQEANCKALLVTVPYVIYSRIGLTHTRGKHLFELSPYDWQEIFKYAGWQVIYDRIYLQYPKFGLMSFLKFYWRQFDYEGFYGAILKRST